MKKTMFAVLAGFLAMGAAQAQTTTSAASPTADTADTAPHAYVGMSVGVVSDTAAGGRRANAKLFGGYEFDRNWAVEAGITRFRTSDFDYWDGVQGSSPSQGHVKSFGAYVAGKYTVPINENFAAYGKFGLSHSERQVKTTTPGLDYTRRDTGLYGGLGVQYKLTRDVAVVAEYERFGKRKAFGPKADVYSVGLKYGF